jgi:nucleotide-binding universal stress UspA family protein
MSYRTILLALDIEAGNAAVIDYAFAFAEKAGATLHTLHASPVGVAPGTAEDAFYAEQRERARSALKLALARHRASPSLGKYFVDTHEPVTAILHTAVAVSADLIVVATHARQGVERWVMGSVAEAVLDEAQASVLVMKSAPSEEPPAPMSA